MEVSHRIRDIEVSQTAKVFAKAIELKEQGLDIVNLGIGEPDFQTPAHINNAAISAIKLNYTKYTVNSGIPELRKAISAQLKNDHGLDYNQDEIIVSCGAKHSVYSTMQAIINPGDEVIIPAPYWVSYTEIVKLAQGIPKIVNTAEEHGFKLTPEKLQKAITPATKLLILCNPSNPTGSVYTRTELEAIANVVVENDLYVISDEIYQKLVYDGFKLTSFPALSKEVKNRTILINGVSKSYSMTGWRIGYAAGPVNVISAINKLQSHLTSNAASISQYAALEAFSGSQTEIEEMRLQFEKRRNYLHKEINLIDGFSCNLPEGAFYLFVNIKKLLGEKIKNSYQFAMYCLDEVLIAGVPGSAFGAEGYFRLSYATSMENLEKVVERLQKISKLLLP